MRIVVVGNGMVGQEFLRLIARKQPADWTVTVFGEERHRAYDRVSLSNYVDHGDAEQLALDSTSFFADNGFDAVLGDAVVTVNREAKYVQTQSGRVEHFDALVLATGSRPFVPPLDGVDAQGVFVYRTLDDLDAIRDYARCCRSGIVLGGGLLGLECANALRKLALSTRIVELAAHLMPAQVDRDAGAIIRTIIENQGYVVETNCSAKRVVVGDGRVKGLQCGDREFACDLLVISAGIVPESTLAREAGLRVGPRGGIDVDDQCRTSDPNIFAIGECARFESRCYGLVEPGYRMAQAAYGALTGNPQPFKHRAPSTKLKLAGANVAAIGAPAESDAETRSWQVTDRTGLKYAKVVVDAATERLQHCVLVGDVSAYDLLVVYYNERLPVSDAIVARALGGVEADSGELPDSAVLCSCKSLCKGDLTREIQRCESLDVKLLKANTGAGTGCGGCVPTLNSLIRQVRAKSGRVEEAVLCDHFPYSRKQLFQKMREHKLATFEEALTKLGKGNGCEVCQPAVASILTALTPHMVIDRDHVASQDFNDRFLANVQRDGTYSIVPRLPAGEVSPARLIALGKIAADFGLYVRITGGQRVAFFGARIEQLPLVWRRLVDEGFESGHTYGKALRTIKTCVGSNWCAWAVQDSTSLAIRLEERYKGLRSPHKTKAGVSGCVRDCAEAKIKDFGLVATDKGWNLVVAGNGGRDAATGKLLAQDVDQDTVVRYLDRLLMYYIRTGDHLARTVTWMNGLPGGIDHLREVLVEDKLGIAAELEEEMQAIVAGGRCEWAATLEDSTVLERFRHYVNAPGTDPTIVHIDERDQHRAATPEERRKLFVLSPTPTSTNWVDVADVGSLVINFGVNALVQGRDVAVFLLRSGRLLAIDNIDPIACSSVLSRGVVVERNGDTLVISPITRKAFSLTTGSCVEKPEYRVQTYKTRVQAGRVQVRLVPTLGTDQHKGPTPGVNPIAAN